MPKLSVEDLNRISERVRQATLLREGAGRAKVTVHMGTCGIAAGARDVLNSLTALLAEKNVDDVLVTTSGCAGLCSQEPMATIELKDEAPIKYVNLTVEKMKHIVEQHVMGGEPVSEYVLGQGSERVS